MKAKELSCKDFMVGDWVYNTHNRQNERVQEIGSGLVMLDYNDLYEYDEIEPIPLTAEILAKNFEGKRNIFGLQTYILDDNFSLEDRRARFCLVRSSNDYTDFKFWVCDIMYVHQLQHALKLFNIEKEIEL